MMTDKKVKTDNRCSECYSRCNSCSSQEWIDKLFTYGCILILSWAVPWSIVGSDCLPGGNLFGLIVLTDACILVGHMVHVIPIPKLPPLPPLLGMLLAGFMLRNIPGLNAVDAIKPKWSSALRSLALTTILVKAGLELDADALKKMKGVCVRLTALPCLVEACACAVACYLLLGFSWEWGFLLGFVLGAVTPAVIVPSLLALQKKQLGTDQGFVSLALIMVVTPVCLTGIPTLVIAASSFDDVLAISGFSVILGIAFSSVQSESVVAIPASNYTATTVAAVPSYNAVTTMQQSDNNQPDAGSLALVILRGPLEMIGGIVIGIVLGAFLWFVPSRNQKSLSLYRTCILYGLGVLSIFGSRLANFPGSGALIAIVAAFVASLNWKEEKVEVSRNLTTLWLIFEPIMFGLIGAEIAVDKMDPNTVGLGVAVLAIGLLFRICATFGAVSFAGLSLREKIFVCFAWLPKATVQAAIGPLALDTARDVDAPAEVIATAEKILTIAALSILITAPLGAAAIGLSGPALLKQATNSVRPVSPSRVMSQDDQNFISEDLQLDDRAVTLESSPLHPTVTKESGDLNL